MNPSKKTVNVKGATTSFFLATSESYHPQWRLMFNNEKTKSKIMSLLPSTPADSIPSNDHFELDGLFNGWYIDVDKLCKEQQLCTLNADGTYDLELVAEFTPQRWFYVGLIISGTTLAGCLGYLGFVGWRKLRRRRGSGGSRPRGHGDKPVEAAPKRPRSRVVRL